MTTSAAIPALGTILYTDDVNNAGNYTAVAEVKTIDGVGIKNTMADVTTLTSAAKEQLATIGEAPSVKLGLSYIPTEATHNASTGLMRDAKNKYKRRFKIVASDAGATIVQTFYAYVGEFTSKYDPDKEIDATCTLEPTGMPTYN